MKNETQTPKEQNQPETVVSNNNSLSLEKETDKTKQLSVSNDNSPSYANLPNDILKLIFSYVQNLEDLMRFALTCKNWHAALTGTIAYQFICLRFIARSPQIIALEDKGNDLVKIDLSQEIKTKIKNKLTSLFDLELGKNFRNSIIEPLGKNTLSYQDNDNLILNNKFIVTKEKIDSIVNYAIQVGPNLFELLSQVADTHEKEIYLITQFIFQKYIVIEYASINDECKERLGSIPFNFYQKYIFPTITSEQLTTLVSLVQPNRVPNQKLGDASNLNQFSDYFVHEANTHAYYSKKVYVGIQYNNLKLITDNIEKIEILEFLSKFKTNDPVLINFIKLHNGEFFLKLLTSQSFNYFCSLTCPQFFRSVLQYLNKENFVKFQKIIDAFTFFQTWGEDFRRYGWSQIEETNPFEGALLNSDDTFLPAFFGYIRGLLKTANGLSIISPKVIKFNTQYYDNILHFAAHRIDHKKFQLLFYFLRIELPYENFLNLMNFDETLGKGFLTLASENKDKEVFKFLCDTIVKYYGLNGLLNLVQEKISKEKGNVLISIISSNNKEAFQYLIGKFTRTSDNKEEFDKLSEKLRKIFSKNPFGSGSAFQYAEKIKEEYPICLETLNQIETTAKTQTLSYRMTAFFMPKEKEAAKKTLAPAVTNSKRVTIAVLPEDILRIVFSYLDFSDLYSAMRTSKSWHKVIHSVIFVPAYFACVAKKSKELEKKPKNRKKISPITTKIPSNIKTKIGNNLKQIFNDYFDSTFINSVLLPLEANRFSYENDGRLILNGNALHQEKIDSITKLFSQESSNFSEFLNELSEEYKREIYLIRQFIFQKLIILKEEKYINLLECLPYKFYENYIFPTINLEQLTDLAKLFFKKNPSFLIEREGETVLNQSLSNSFAQSFSESLFPFYLMNSTTLNKEDNFKIRVFSIKNNNQILFEMGKLSDEEKEELFLFFTKNDLVSDLIRYSDGTLFLDILYKKVPSLDENTIPFLKKNNLNSIFFDSCKYFNLNNFQNLFKKYDSKFIFLIGSILYKSGYHSTVWGSHEDNDKTGEYTNKILNKNLFLGALLNPDIKILTQLLEYASLGFKQEVFEESSKNIILFFVKLSQKPISLIQAVRNEFWDDTDTPPFIAKYKNVLDYALAKIDSTRIAILLDFLKKTEKINLVNLVEIEEHYHLVPLQNALLNDDSQVFITLCEQFSIDDLFYLANQTDSKGKNILFKTIELNKLDAFKCLIRKFENDTQKIQSLALAKTTALIGVTAFELAKNLKESIPDYFDTLNEIINPSTKNIASNKQKKPLVHEKANTEIKKEESTFKHLTGSNNSTSSENNNNALEATNLTNAPQSQNSMTSQGETDTTSNKSQNGEEQNQLVPAAISNDNSASYPDMQKLPDEILKLIFSYYIKDPETFANIVRVCKKWKEIIYSDPGNGFKYLSYLSDRSQFRYMSSNVFSYQGGETYPAPAFIYLHPSNHLNLQAKIENSLNQLFGNELITSIRLPNNKGISENAIVFYERGILFNNIPITQTKIDILLNYIIQTYPNPLVFFSFYWDIHSVGIYLIGQLIFHEWLRTNNPKYGAILKNLSRIFYEKCIFPTITLDQLKLLPELTNLPDADENSPFYNLHRINNSNFPFNQNQKEIQKNYLEIFEFAIRYNNLKLAFYVQNEIKLEDLFSNPETDDLNIENLIQCGDGKLFLSFICIKDTWGYLIDKFTATYLLRLILQYFDSDNFIEFSKKEHIQSFWNTWSELSTTTSDRWQPYSNLLEGTLLNKDKDFFKTFLTNIEIFIGEQGEQLGSFIIAQLDNYVSTKPRYKNILHFAVHQVDHTKIKLLIPFFIENILLENFLNLTKFDYKMKKGLLRLAAENKDKKVFEILCDEIIKSYGLHELFNLLKEEVDADKEGNVLIYIANSEKKEAFQYLTQKFSLEKDYYFSQLSEDSLAIFSKYLFGHETNAALEPTKQIENEIIDKTDLNNAADSQNNADTLKSTNTENLTGIPGSQSTTTPQNQTINPTTHSSDSKVPNEIPQQEGVNPSKLTTLDVSYIHKQVTRSLMTRTEEKQYSPKQPSFWINPDDLVDPVDQSTFENQVINFISFLSEPKILKKIVNPEKSETQDETTLTKEQPDKQSAKNQPQTENESNVNLTEDTGEDQTDKQLAEEESAIQYLASLMGKENDALDLISFKIDIFNSKSTDINSVYLLAKNALVPESFTEKILHTYLLKAYIEEREDEKKQQKNSEYLNFYGRIWGSSATDKINAAKKCILKIWGINLQELNNILITNEKEKLSISSEELTDKERKAFLSDRLGKLVRKISKMNEKSSEQEILQSLKFN